MADLKPCPKCGKKPQLIESKMLGVTLWYKYYCCNVLTKMKETHEEAIEAWNRLDGGKENAVD